MFARYFMVLPALLMVSGCSGNANKGEIETGLDNSVFVDSEEPYVDDSNDFGPERGTQADLVVNVGDRVFFETDSSELTMMARTTLESQAVWLDQYPQLNIDIEGHADERGTREYNLALGDRRANSVKNYLVALGVDPLRVSTISYGKERPAVPGSDKNAWSQNRRGVAKVQ